jgi:hypothetical protein
MDGDCVLTVCFGGAFLFTLTPESAQELYIDSDELPSRLQQHCSPCVPLLPNAGRIRSMDFNQRFQPSGQNRNLGEIALV